MQTPHSDKITAFALRPLLRYHGVAATLLEILRRHHCDLIRTPRDSVSFVMLYFKGS